MEIANQVNIIGNILGKRKTKNHTGRKNAEKVDRYVWSIEDELLAIKLYKQSATKEEISLAITNTKIKLSSMLMKISNIKYLDTGIGLENVSDTTKTLFEKYGK